MLNTEDQIQNHGNDQEISHNIQRDKTTIGDIEDSILSVGPESVQNINIYKGLPPLDPSANTERNASDISREVTNVPLAPSIFVGREDEIREFKSRIIERTSAQNQTIVRGWPGVGKTSFVTTLAKDPEIRAEFPDGILWAAAGQNSNPIELLASWERTLGILSNKPATSLNEAVDRLRNLLRNRHVMLIIDDVWNTEDAIPLMAGDDQSFTLITTRFQKVANELAATPDDIYLLDILTLEQSQQLFGLRAPNSVQALPSETEKWLDDIERLPLAIHVGARLLERQFNALGAEPTLKLLNEIGSKILDADAPRDRYEMGEIPTVEVLLKYSTDRLDQDARTAFAYLGICAPKPATFSLDLMKTIWENGDAQAIVLQLVDFGLLEPIPPNNRFQLHALLVIHAKAMLENFDTNQESQTVPTRANIFWRLFNMKWLRR